MLKLFPHMLLRVCGGSFNELESLDLDETSEIFEQISKFKKRIKELRESLSEKI